MAFTDDEKYAEANRVLEAAFDLEGTARDRYIASECKSRPGLEKSVMRLLALSEKLDGFIDLPPVAAAEITPGDLLLGRFRILRTLGEGGMGSVFLADDRDLGEVAIKAIRLDLRNNPAAVERFRAEVRLARSVSHPNVCPIFDLFSDEGRLFFTLRYFPGETLAERIARGPVPLDEALAIARGIAAGLDALHAEGVIHRDLKPSNIILRQLGDGSVRPVITDFGLAWGPSGESGGQVLGSPDYMAPEQFRGTVAKAVDIFAFGVMLFEMIAGRPPWPKEDVLAAALRRNCDETPRLRSFIPSAPEEWDTAVARALARDPKLRFDSARAIIGELERETEAPLPRRAAQGCGRNILRATRAGCGPGANPDSPAPAPPPLSPRRRANPRARR